MQFAKNPPARKRKHRSNRVTEHPVFEQLVRAMRGGTPRAALVFELDDAKKLKVEHPWRVAVEQLRRIVKEEGLPYHPTKYQTETGGWAVQVVRKDATKDATEEGRKRTNERLATKSA